MPFAKVAGTILAVACATVLVWGIWRTTMASGRLPTAAMLALPDGGR